eukprot:gene23703-16864_t
MGHAYHQPQLYGRTLLEQLQQPVKSKQHVLQSGLQPEHGRPALRCDAPSVQGPCPWPSPSAVHDAKTRVGRVGHVVHAIRALRHPPHHLTAPPPASSPIHQPGAPPAHHGVHVSPAHGRSDVRKCSTGTIESAVSKCSTGTIESAVSKCSTGTIESAVSKCSTGTIESAHLHDGVWMQRATAAAGAYGWPHRTGHASA